MIRRAAFVLITLFWLVMNALLWRSEFGSSPARSSSVHLPMVWRRVLTAPDSSSMELFLRGQKIGFVRWTPSIREAQAATDPFSDEPLEGMVKTPLGYAVELEGNISSDNPPSRFRLHGHLEFDTNQAWQEFSFTLGVRTNSWSLKTRAQEQAVEIKVDQDGVSWKRRFTLAELRNPASLLAEFGLPVAPGMLPNAGLLGVSQLASSLRWEARNDLLRVGHSQLRVYRIQARWLERYDLRVTISRVGEILRVDLPNGVVLKNEVALNW